MSRRRRARLTRTVAVFTAALFAASWGLLAVRPAQSHPPYIPVLVNGVPHVVPGPGPTSLASVLRASQVRVRGSRLYSAGSHRLLSSSVGVPTLLVDGLPATEATAVLAGSSVVAVNGPDLTEAVAEQTASVPVTAGLPDVESVLWYPGSPGTEVTTVGVVSGEVVGRRVQAQAVAPRRELAPVVALTFDDGPDPRWTPQVLQILREEGIKATFCEVGYLAQRHPELVRQVVAEGHTLCNHTMHHAEHLDAAPHDRVAQEIDEGYRALAAAAGRPPAMYRAPGGHLGPDVVGTARAGGMRVLAWSIDPSDYERPPPEALAQRVVSVVRPGAVVLLHDGGGDRSGTVAATRLIIQQLKAMGWSFATPTPAPRLIPVFHITP